MFRFETLEIWKLSLEYCNNCYDIAKKFPSYELFALADQLRRAAISGPNNIVEGSGSDSDKLFSRYLNIAINSIYETVNILIFAEMRRYVNENEKNLMYNKAEILIKKIKAFKRSLSR